MKKETTEEKHNLTEVVFILDRSGSMGGLEKDTIGGYNSLLKKQKNEEGDVIFSTVLFDDRIEVLPVVAGELKEGDQLVVTGQARLTDGDALEIVE